MFEFKMVQLLKELLGVVVIPFVLIFKTSQSSFNVIDFFREFSVHVDGVGYVCSFAVFDFKRHGNPKYGSYEPTDKYHRSKQGKMEKSFISFRNNFPNWEPDQQGSLYSKRVKESIISEANEVSSHTLKTPIDWEFGSFYNK